MTDQLADTRSALHILSQVVERIIVGGRWPGLERREMLQQIDDLREIIGINDEGEQTP